MSYLLGPKIKKDEPIGLIRTCPQERLQVKDHLFFLPSFWLSLWCTLAMPQIDGGSKLEHHPSYGHGIILFPITKAK